MKFLYQSNRNREIWIIFKEKKSIFLNLQFILYFIKLIFTNYNNEDGVSLEPDP